MSEQALKRLAAFSLLLLAAGCWALWQALKQPPAAPAKVPETTPQTSQLSFAGATLTGYSGKTKLWEVRADSLEVEQTSPVTLAKGHVQAVLFDAAGKVYARLTANTIRLNSYTKNLEARGQVVVTTARGLVVATELARWLQAERKLYCPGRLEANTATIRLKAPSLSLFTERERVECPGPVVLKLKGLELTAQKLRADSRFEHLDLADGVKGWVALNSFLPRTKGR